MGGGGERGREIVHGRNSKLIFREFDGSLAGGGGGGGWGAEK